MAGETTITVIGNLVDDPELRFTPSGAPVANFRIASTPRQFDRQANEWKDGETLFIGCTAWRNTAENVTESLQRGMEVVAIGELNSRKYGNREGEKCKAFNIEIVRIAPYLSRQTDKVTKVTRADAQGQQRGQQAPQQTQQQAPAPQQQQQQAPQQSAPA